MAGDYFYAALELGRCCGVLPGEHFEDPVDGEGWLKPAAADSGSVTRAYPRRSRSARSFNGAPADTSQRARSNAGDAGPANSQSMTPTTVPSSIRRFLGRKSPWASQSGGAVRVVISWRKKSAPRSTTAAASGLSVSATMREILATAPSSGGRSSWRIPSRRPGQRCVRAPEFHRRPWPTARHQRPAARR